MYSITRRILLEYTAFNTKKQNYSTKKFPHSSKVKQVPMQSFIKFTATKMEGNQILQEKNNIEKNEYPPRYYSQ